MKKKVFLVLMLATVSTLTYAEQNKSNNQDVSFANFFYQKGYSEGFKTGYQKGYMAGYKQALEDAKILLKVANKQIRAVKAGCELLEKKYGQSLAIILVKKNGQFILKPFISQLNLVDNWQEIAQLGVPVVNQALAIKFESAKQRVLAIPKLSQGAEVETKPPVKEFIAKLPSLSTRYLKLENIPFAVIQGKNEVIAIFNSKEDYERFCQTYKVCK